MKEIINKRNQIESELNLILDYRVNDIDKNEILSKYTEMIELDKKILDYRLERIKKILK